MRSKGAVDAVVVGIEPSDSLWAEQLRKHRRSVDVTQSQCLEIKPVSELGNACFTAEDDVLVTDAVYTFSVKSRLIGCNHSRKKRLRIILETDRLRSFVNAEVVSHSVTGSVAEVSAGTPQRHTREGVELMAGSAARECCHRKIYHTLEN